MDEEFITKTEFLMLVALGMVLPWLVTTAFQIRIYIRHNVTPIRMVASSVLTFLLTAALGVVLWVAVPYLTVFWQLVAERLPGRVANVLSFFPVIPMTISALVVAFVVTAVFLKWRTNA